MGSLNLRAAPGEFDETYNSLLKAFSRYPDDRQIEFASALLVILCNHIGDSEVIEEALELAGQAMTSPESDEPDTGQGCE